MEGSARRGAQRRRAGRASGRAVSRRPRGERGRRPPPTTVCCESERSSRPALEERGAMRRWAQSSPPRAARSNRRLRRPLICMREVHEGDVGRGPRSGSPKPSDRVARVWLPEVTEDLGIAPGQVVETGWNLDCDSVVDGGTYGGGYPLARSARYRAVGDSGGTIPSVPPLAALQRRKLRLWRSGRRTVGSVPGRSPGR